MLGIGEVPELGGDRDAKAETGGRGERRLLWCVARPSVFRYVCDLCVFGFVYVGGVVVVWGRGGVKRGWRRDRADRELVTAAHGVDAFGASVVDENVARARFTVMKNVVVCSGMQIQHGTRPAENMLGSPGFNWKALVGRLGEY